MLSRLRALRTQARTREPAQIIVLFAVFMIVLMVLAGSAYDYASIVVDDAQLQNAVDAAVLAGSDSLSRNATLPNQTPEAIASMTAVKYLSLNGVNSGAANTTVNISFPTSTPVAGVTPPATPVIENISVSVTRSHQTAFWPLIGVPKVTMSGGGTAHAARGLIDVALILDTTLSMQNSGSIPAVQDAVVAFVTGMRPDPADPRGPRIALARFQGLQCASGNPNFTGCYDDYNLLTTLTADKAALIETANATGAGTCLFSVTYACGIKYASNSTPSTKLPNAIHSIFDPTPADRTHPSNSNSLGTYVFGNGAGGRNDNSVGGIGYAKKIAIMMTDGFDQAPTGCNLSICDDVGTGAGTWDTSVKALATTLKNGPDGIAGTQDDVELYVVNFQCSQTDQYQSNNCMSQLAGRAIGDHLCPTTLPSGSLTSPTDELLIAVSSSKVTDCSHYFPLRKDEDLPGLFLSLAGTISRGALTN